MLDSGGAQGCLGQPRKIVPAVCAQPGILSLTIGQQVAELHHLGALHEFRLILGDRHVRAVCGHLRDRDLRNLGDLLRFRLSLIPLARLEEIPIRHQVFHWQFDSDPANATPRLEVGS